MKILPSNEAADYYRRRGVQINNGQLRHTIANYDDVVFTVAGVNKLAALEELNASLQKSLAEGESFREWKKRTLDSFKARNKKDRAKLRRQGKLQKFSPIPFQGGLNDARMRLVFRNSMARARQSGQWQRIQKNKLTHPYILYDGVLDNRIRPTHRALDGLILPVTDPLWNSIAPPNGHNCRCSLIPLSARDLKEMKLTQTSKAKVKRINPVSKIDRGFNTNPGANWIADSVQQKANQIDRLLSPQTKAERSAFIARPPSQLIRRRRATVQATSWRKTLARENIAKAVAVDLSLFAEAHASSNINLSVSSRIVSAFTEQARNRLGTGLMRLLDQDIKGLVSALGLKDTLALPILLASEAYRISRNRKVIAYQSGGNFIIVSRYWNETRVTVRRRLPKEIVIKGKINHKITDIDW